MNLTAATFSTPIFSVTNHDRPMQPKLSPIDVRQRRSTADRLPAASFHIRLEGLIPGEYSLQTCAIASSLACTTYRFLVGHAALHPLDAYEHAPRLRLSGAYGLGATPDYEGGFRLAWAPVESTELPLDKWAPPSAARIFGAFTQQAYPGGPAVLAMYDNHDSSVCIAVGGEILLLLELERLMDRKHFNLLYKRDYGLAVDSASSSRTVTEPPTMLVLKMALDHAKAVTRVRAFDYASWVGLTRPNWFLVDSEPARTAVFLPDAMPRAWAYPAHHACHALLAAVSSPLAAKTALVLSYDGGGNDGGFNVYVYDRRARVGAHGTAMSRARPVLRRVTNVWQPLGMQYAVIASMVRAINPSLTPQPFVIEGTAMAYAALGSVRDEWKRWMRGVFEDGLFRADWGGNSIVPRLRAELKAQLRTAADAPLAADQEDEKEGADVAATNQAVFEETVLFRLSPHLQARLQHVSPVWPSAVCCTLLRSHATPRHRPWVPVHTVSTVSASGTLRPLAKPELFLQCCADRWARTASCRSHARNARTNARTRCTHVMHARG